MEISWVFFEDVFQKTHKISILGDPVYLEKSEVK